MATNFTTTGVQIASTSVTALAWVNYNQSGDTEIDSYNVSSVDDVATGKYQVNFDADLANNLYCAVASCGGGGTEAGGVSKGTVCCPKESGTTYATTSVTCQTSVNFSHLDVGTNCVIVFGD